MSEPVTVSITRIVDPSHEDEMLAWMRAGTELAERFEGFLGSGWMRPAAGSSQWHMLYRFSGTEALNEWEASDQRGWWLAAAQGMVGDSHVEKRTGIEGWFDDPSSTDVVDLRPAPTPPPRWKQMCVIFTVFFPLSLLSNYLAREWLAAVELPLRVLISTLVLTPVMTYAGLPWATRLFHRWLNA